MSLESLKRQVTLEHAVRECERLHPPLINADPQGTQNPCATETISCRPAPWPWCRRRSLTGCPTCLPTPERFHPDRFAPPACEDKQHQYALIGFGGGKHRCMGKHFAYLQLKAIWTVLLDRFDFHLDTAFPAPNYGSWVTGPETPCLLRYRRRSQGSIVR